MIYDRAAEVELYVEAWMSSFISDCILHSIIVIREELVMFGACLFFSMTFLCLFLSLERSKSYSWAGGSPYL